MYACSIIGFRILSWVKGIECLNDRSVNIELGNMAAFLEDLFIYQMHV